MLQWQTKPYYTRIALVGIAMYLVILSLIFVLTVVFVPAQWAYPLVVAAIVCSIGAAIYFVHPWGLAAGVLGGMVGVLFALDGLTDLRSPDSFIDFIYRPVFGSAGAILVLGGCSAALIQHVRGRTSPRGPSTVTTAVRYLVVLVAVLSLTSAVLTVAGRDHVTASEKEGATMITAEAWAFDVDALSAATDRPTRLLVKNDDLVIHTFTIDALDVDQRVGPGSEALIEIPPPPPGVYEFRCRVAGHDAMRGTLTVQ